MPLFVCCFVYVSCLLTRATELSRQIARVLIIMLGEAGAPPKRRRVQ